MSHIYSTHKSRNPKKLTLTEKGGGGGIGLRVYVHTGIVNNGITKRGFRFPARGLFRFNAGFDDWLLLLLLLLGRAAAATTAAADVSGRRSGSHRGTRLRICCLLSILQKFLLKRRVI